MNATAAGTLGLVLALATLGWGAYWKSRFHRAKAEVYQEFSDTFSAMGQFAWVKDKARKKAEQKRTWMRLILCDPVCANALRDALADADEHWNRCPECKQPRSEHGWVKGQGLVTCPEPR